MKKLHSESKEENTPDFEKISCKNEDSESETSELEDVDCSAFVGTSSVEGSKEVGNSLNNNTDLNVCNNDKLNVFRTKIACEQMNANDKKETACEPLVNEPACEPPQSEKVFHEPKIEKLSPEVVKVKDITYKTLKKEGQLR